MKRYSITSKYTAAVPRSQRRKNIEGRSVVAGYSAGGGSGVDRSYVDANFVTLATEQVVTAHKDFAVGISMYGIPWEYDVERDAWTIKGNVIITKGLATYSALKEDDVLSVFDGLPIDNDTLQWQETEGGKVLVAVGGGSGGGLDEDKLKDYLDEEKYVTEDWVTGKNYALKSDLDTVSTKLDNFLEGSDTDNLAEILSTKFDKTDFTKAKIKETLGISDWALSTTNPSYTKAEADDKYLLKTGTAADSSKLGGTAATYFARWADHVEASSSYKHLGYGYSSDGWYTTGPATVFGVSNYKAALQFRWTDSHFYAGYGYETNELSNWKKLAYITDTVDAAKQLLSNSKGVYYDSAKDAWVVEGNLVVTGGLATYTKLSGFTNLDVMGGVVTDGTTIHINSAGQLEVIGGTGGGGSVSITGAASTIVSSNLTASRALVSNSSGKVAVSSITSTKLGYLTDVTSNIQAQLNNKQATLVSGTNIKTINNQSILGSGNITISGGSGGGITLSDVADYLDENDYVTRGSAGALANISALTPANNATDASGITIGSQTLTYRSLYAQNIYPRPAYALRVYTSESSATVNYLERLRVGAKGTVQIAGTTTDTSIKLYVNGVAKATSFAQTSDRKLKNVDYEGDGLDLDALKKVKVAKWHWKDKRSDRREIGGIADDILSVIPEVVFTQDDGTLMMDYGKAGFSIAASLIAPVARHEDRIKELEKNIEKMQKELKQLRTA